MNLEQNKELFEQAILQTSEKLNINPAIVERDYYVTKMVKNLVEGEPNIIFKGGTSLSKCYKLIQRFSEDIDLNYENQGEKPTEGMRKNLSKLVRETGELLEMQSMNPHLIVETAIAIQSFPTEILKADCFIFQFLQDENHIELIDE